MKFLKFYKFSFWLIVLALLGWMAPSSRAAMLVTSVQNNSILRYNDKTGEFIDTFVPTGRGGLDGPTSIVFVKDIPEPSYVAAISAFVFVGGLSKLRNRKKSAKYLVD